MEEKINTLYTSLQAVTSGALEENRNDFIKWFLKNDMRSFIRSFFNNNLSIGATAKDLHLGESTVVFRLSRIEHFTGLNIRKFWDAVVLVESVITHGLQ